MKFTAECYCGWKEEVSGSLSGAVPVLSRRVVEHQKEHARERMPAPAPRPEQLLGMFGHWEWAGEVESSSEPGAKHVIKRHRTTGQYGCDCKSYRFSKGTKTCRHLEAFGIDVGRSRSIAQHEGSKRSSTFEHRGETFTVRRAITFGKIPTGG